MSRSGMDPRLIRLDLPGFKLRMGEHVHGPPESFRVTPEDPPRHSDVTRDTPRLSPKPDANLTPYQAMLAAGAARVAARQNDAAQALARAVNRTPCIHCGTRRDIGCPHQRPVE